MSIKLKEMEKTLYWLVESNGDLSVTVNDITLVKEIIEADFANESEDGVFDFAELQYTVTPKMLTKEEYEAFGEA